MEEERKLIKISILYKVAILYMAMELRTIS